MTSRHLLPTVLLSLGLGLGFAACGDDTDNAADIGGVPNLPAESDGDGSSPDAPPTDPSDDPGDAALAYSQCMRDNGVEDFPDPLVDGDGRVVIQDSLSEDADVVGARDVCESLLPAGGGFDAPDESSMAQMQDQMLEFATCMRDQGIDFPDPKVGADGSFLIEASSADPDAPAYQAALETCSVADDVAAQP